MGAVHLEARLLGRHADHNNHRVRLALISDQHGNDVAFRAVADDIERIGVDAVICLGDVVQGGAQPAESLARLASLDCPTVLGNADAFLLGMEVAGERHARASSRSATGRSRRSGTGDSRRFARSSPLSRPSWKSRRCSASTALPARTTTSSSPTATATLDPWLVDADLLAGGHTHKQWARPIGRALFVNPGAVGLAYDYHQPEDDFRFDAVAEYASSTIGPHGPAVEFRRVPYSLAELRRVVLASGRPNAEKHIGMYRE